MASGKSRGFVRAPSKKPFIAPKPARIFKVANRPASHTQDKLTSWKDTKTTADLNQAAQLANSGQLREAAEICRFYLIETGPSAQAYYLLGLVLDATDKKGDAAEHYRKALYLEPDHIEALTQLALLTENMGDDTAAKRLRDRIKRTEARVKK